MQTNIFLLIIELFISRVVRLQDLNRTQNWRVGFGLGPVKFATDYRYPSTVKLQEPVEILNNVPFS
jgi:hypothetical protein